MIDANTKQAQVGLCEKEVSFLLTSAERAVEGSGYAWVHGPLTKFLRAGKPMPDLPASIIDRFGDSDSEFKRWAVLAQPLVRAVEAKDLPAHRVRQITVPDAVTMLGNMLDQEADRKAKEVERARRSGRLENALARGASWAWQPVDPDKPHLVGATLSIGSIAFGIYFSQQRKGDTWWFAWGPTTETSNFLRAYEGRRTGLFPVIDRALREILADFMAKAKPNGVQIVGADQKRNDHNAGTYADLTPPGYRFVVDRNGEGAPGGIRFVANEPIADSHLDEATQALFSAPRRHSIIDAVLERLQDQRRIGAVADEPGLYGEKNIMLRT